MFRIVLYHTIVKKFFIGFFCYYFIIFIIIVFKKVICLLSSKLSSLLILLFMHTIQFCDALSFIVCSFKCQYDPSLIHGIFDWVIHHQLFSVSSLFFVYMLIHVYFFPCSFMVIGWYIGLSSITFPTILVVIVIFSQFLISHISSSQSVCYLLFQSNVFFILLFICSCLNFQYWFISSYPNIISYIYIELYIIYLKIRYNNI